jgi:hypothetical protein
LIYFLHVSVPVEAKVTEFIYSSLLITLYSLSIISISPGRHRIWIRRKGVHRRNSRWQSGAGGASTRIVSPSHPLPVSLSLSALSIVASLPPTHGPARLYPHSSPSSAHTCSTLPLDPLSTPPLPALCLSTNKPTAQRLAFLCLSNHCPTPPLSLSLSPISVCLFTAEPTAQPSLSPASVCLFTADPTTQPSLRLCLSIHCPTPPHSLPSLSTH